MTTMLALRAHQGAEALVLEEVPVPEPGPLDVVVKVVSAGLAPGIMRLLRMGALKHLPTTLGHEAAGVVSAVGRDVTGHAVGDRVRVHPLLNCRECDYCRTDRDMMCAQQAMLGHAAFGDAPMPLYEQYHDGGLAEYVRVPHWLIDSLPDSVGFDVAARSRIWPTPCAHSSVPTFRSGPLSWSPPRPAPWEPRRSSSRSTSASPV
ncbi:alcohol dehydrogenase catalytic domain-containing protein [Streptomyces sp. NPDC048523]|uniref:alcohol dehydrogenase catalytic domain-containing protein n=1 Tax=Streptomyces sp. NPDC048523 TaxID=3365567 RepID=UPI003724A36C